MRQLTVAMYHYVRDLRHSRFPEIKGLATDQFRAQIKYIKKHYHVVSGNDVIQGLAAQAELPPRAALLTFDDGYLDHFTQVFPILDQEGITGCFFPPANAILGNRVLDVNKIHFTLAAVQDKKQLAQHVLRQLEKYREQYNLAPAEQYWERLAKPSRFDDAEVIFIKRILQREVPDELRSIILDDIFGRYVTADETSFAKELYMSVEQIQCLHRSGMLIGSHGAKHKWLGSLSVEEQREEIEASLAFLKSLGVSIDQWSIAYPYGSYNDSLLALLREYKCALGFSTRTDIADLSQENPFTIPRLDTNDLPKDEFAEPNEWLKRIL